VSPAECFKYLGRRVWLAAVVDEPQEGASDRLMITIELAQDFGIEALDAQSTYRHHRRERITHRELEPVPAEVGEKVR
jgi:hypothetical protein